MAKARTEPRRRSSFTRSFVLVAATLLVLAPAAGAASKKVDSFFPATAGPGTLGGEFDTPSGVAANDPSIADGSGTDSWVYVVDRNNNRVQAFSPPLLPAGGYSFEWAVGRDVVAPGGTGNVPNNEQQTILVEATGGTYTVRIDLPGGTTVEETTVEIPFDAAASEVQAALEGTDVVEPGDLAVVGPASGPYVVDFTGALADTNIAQLRFGSNGNKLTGGNSRVIFATTDEGANSVERCVVAAECKAGEAGTDGGMLASASGLAIDQASGHLFVHDTGNRRIQELDANGAFIKAFGANVVQAGGAGNISSLLDERQEIRLEPLGGATITGGSFTLSFGGQTTDPIAWNATATAVDSALEALATIGAGNVSVAASSGETWEIEFVGSLAGTNVDALTGDGSQIVTNGFGAANVRVLTLVAGGAEGVFEVCIVASECRSGGEAGTAGALGTSATRPGLAVVPVGAPNVGNLVVADPGNRRLLEFDPSGSGAGIFVRGWGWNVDLTGGSAQFEICAAAGCRPAADPFFNETSFGMFQNGDPRNVAVDSRGVVYADGSRPFGFGSFGRRIERFDSTEGSATDLLLEPMPEFAATAGSRAESLALALDPDSDGAGPDFDLLYQADRSPAGRRVVSFDLREEPPLTDDNPHFNGIPIAPLGLAVNPVLGGGTGTLYATTNNLDPTSPNGTGHRVYAADDDGAGVPQATIEDPPNNITGDSAELVGSVNPEGFPESTAQFQISLNGTDWTGVGAPQPLPEVDVDVEVTETATGLSAGTAYRARLAVSKGYGAGTGFSAEIEFQTLILAPDAVTSPPLDSGPTHATVAGRVNPNGSPTTYRFEYVEEAEFQANGFSNASRAPSPDGHAGSGGTAVEVVQRLEDLSPFTTYRFRLRADSTEGSALGDVRRFTTPGAAHPVPNGRAFEMVSPPFKNTRSTAAAGNAPGNNPNPALPALDGETLVWKIEFLPLSDEVGASAWGDNNLLRRTPHGWTISTLNSLGFLPETQPTYARNEISSSNADFSTLGWDTTFGSAQTGLLPPNEGSTPSKLYTRRDGTGVAGFTSWVPNPDAQQYAVGFTSNQIASSDVEASILNDDGTAMARSGRYRGLGEDPSTSGDDDPSDDQQLAGEEGGVTLYAQHAANPDLLPAAPKDLVGECTGTVAAGDATQIPERVGSGVATDLIGARACEEGNVTSVRGAGLPTAPATALSDDGARIFFRSPAVGSPPSSCSTATGSGTDCPPQLFVRSYGDEEAAVRWISRSRSTPVGDNGFGGPMIGGQQIAEMGRGAFFEGASRDGGVVYFRTNAPIVPDDPNGGNSITEGSASADSWDLYRYELPEDPGDDPGNGVLTRISGGPSGSADPSVARSLGNAASLRFHSDDGRRAYFLTTSPIAGADVTPPAGGSTAPAGTVSAADNEIGVRNLYLFEDTGGSSTYTFIAQIPYSASDDQSPANLNKCASNTTELSNGHLNFFGEGISGTQSAAKSCFRGTADGKHVVFFTRGQLTADDTDDAGDIYLYDAAGDELTRITAPRPGAEPYVCNTITDGGGRGSTPAGMCHGDLGPQPGGIQSGFSTVAGDGGNTTRGWGGHRYDNVAVEKVGGVSIFFESRSQLVPEDTNGDHFDVYQWKGGELSLISPGNTPDNSWFSGNSTDGEDVFIFTSARIDPRELDPSDFDIYDARVGGGFPYTAPPEPCNVLAFKCESEAVSGPGAPSSATLVSGPSGNVTSPKARRRVCGKRKVRRGKRCVNKLALARKRCRKVRSSRRAKRHCIRKQARRLSRAKRKRARAIRAQRRAGRNR